MPAWKPACRPGGLRYFSFSASCCAILLSSPASELLAGASPREVTVQVCLAGDVGAELEALEAELGQLGEWQPTNFLPSSTFT